MFSKTSDTLKQPENMSQAGPGNHTILRVGAIFRSQIRTYFTGVLRGYQLR